MHLSDFFILGRNIPLSKAEFDATRGKMAHGLRRPEAFDRESEWMTTMTLGPSPPGRFARVPCRAFAE